MGVKRKDGPRTQAAANDIVNGLGIVQAGIAEIAKDTPTGEFQIIQLAELLEFKCRKLIERNCLTDVVREAYKEPTWKRNRPSD